MDAANISTTRSGRRCATASRPIACLPSARRFRGSANASSVTCGARPTSSRPLAALAVKLIDQKAFRAGHEKYAKDGGRGIASLRNSDLKINGNIANFVFAGKSKKKNEIAISDHSAVRRLKALKRRGRLFQYKDKQRWRSLHAGELNQYLHEISGSKVSAKDFRTFHGSARALAFLAEVDAKTDTPESGPLLPPCVMSASSCAIHLRSHDRVMFIPL